LIYEICLILQDINQSIVSTNYFFSSIEMGDDNSSGEVYER